MQQRPTRPTRRQGAQPVEVYGFVGSIASVVAYVLYILWAYIPERYLRAAGITYYPSKYWAIALPAYAMVTVVLAVLVYTALNMITAKPRDCVKDSYSRPRLPQPPRNASIADEDYEDSIPPISDMDAAEVDFWLNLNDTQ